MFDVNEFKYGESELNLKDAIPLPDGEEFHGVVLSLDNDVNVRTVETANGTSHILELTFHMDDPRAKEITNNEDPTARWSAWLDIADSCQLDDAPGKNSRLSHLRRAMKQEDGKPWGPKRVVGVPVICTIKQRMSNDGNDVYVDVSRVRAA